MIKAVMFDTKPYDRESFERLLGSDISLDCYETRLDSTTVGLPPVTTL